MTTIKLPVDQMIRDVRNASARLNKALAENQAEEARRVVHAVSGDLKNSIHTEQDSDGTAYCIAGNEKVNYAEIEEYIHGHPFMTPAREKTIRKSGQIASRIRVF